MAKKITCDNCKSEKVKKYIAECFVEYDFDYNKQSWSDNHTIINEPIDSKHFCQECYEKWAVGDLF